MQAVGTLRARSLIAEAESSGSAQRGHAGPCPPAAENTPGRRPIPGRLLSRLGVLAFGLVLALLVAELGLRLLAPVRPMRLLPFSYDAESIDRLVAAEANLTFDADLGWEPSPDVDRVGDEKISYSHNHAGLRADREYEPVPPPGIRRYAAYGDSFTYCTDSTVGNCWTHKLEQLLDRSEVLNFGVPSYAPDQAWLRYQRNGAAYQPCAVLIGHMVENINRVVNRFRPFYQPQHYLPLAKPRFVLDANRAVLLPNPARQPELLKDPAWVEANLGPGDAFYFPGMFVANPFDRFELIRLVRTVIFRHDHDETDIWNQRMARRTYVPGTEAFEVLTAVLTQFADEVRADGATPVVLVFPTRVEIERQRDGREKIHAPLLQVLNQRGIATIDLTDAMGRQAHSADLNNLAPRHYRPLGNQVVARTLKEQLPRLTAQTCGAG